MSIHGSTWFIDIRSIFTRFNPYFGWYKIRMQTVGIKSSIYAKECYNCISIWLHVLKLTEDNTGWCIIHSSIAISVWFQLFTRITGVNTHYCIVYVQ